MSETFLDAAEVRELTGRTKVALQVAHLRAQGIPFFTNALGRPIVPRAAIEGRATTATAPKKAWVPKVLQPG